MKAKFEVGKIYKLSGNKLIIIKRTPKMVIYKELQHYNRFNERIVREGRAKIREWPNGEVILTDYWECCATDIA